MPNGGIHHCGNCKHFNIPFCRLRAEEITSSHWTTCRSWNESHRVPYGTLYSIVCEVKNKAGSYHDVPYYLGCRVETEQDKDSLETVVAYIDKNAKWIGFKSIEEYNEHYQKMFDKPFLLIGAIAGDIIGSVYERHNIKQQHFPLFSDRSLCTDDTVMTIAVASKLLNDSGSYLYELREFGKKYPKAGYGGDFKNWLFCDDPQPYGSYGNGSAMRVSPVGYAFKNIDDVWLEATKSAEITHNHPEGIKGAVAVASAVFLARNGCSKQEIKDYIETNFKYNLNRTIDEIRPSYHFDVSCQGSVPEAIISFLESHDFESSIRLAVSIGGDSDTIASISGAIAEAFYMEIPKSIKVEGLKRLPDEFLNVLMDFTNKYKNE